MGTEAKRVHRTLLGDVQSTRTSAGHGIAASPFKGHRDRSWKIANVDPPRLSQGRRRHQRRLQLADVTGATVQGRAGGAAATVIEAASVKAAAPRGAQIFSSFGQAWRSQDKGRDAVEQVLPDQAWLGERVLVAGQHQAHSTAEMIQRSEECLLDGGAQASEFLHQEGAPARGFDRDLQRAVPFVANDRPSVVVDLEREGRFPPEAAGPRINTFSRALLIKAARSANSTTSLQRVGVGADPSRALGDHPGHPRARPANQEESVAQSRRPHRP
jgi:hypothetical protein